MERGWGTSPPILYCLWTPPSATCSPVHRFPHCLQILTAPGGLSVPPCLQYPQQLLAPHCISSPAAWPPPDALTHGIHCPLWSPVPHQLCVPPRCPLPPCPPLSVPPALSSPPVQIVLTPPCFILLLPSAKTPPFPPSPAGPLVTSRNPSLPLDAPRFTLSPPCTDPPPKPPEHPLHLLSCGPPRCLLDTPLHPAPHGPPLYSPPPR